MELKIQQLKKTFGDKTAVDIDSYSVADGEIVGLVGNNGAGKTTMFRLILDLLKPDTGSASINGIVTSESEEWKNVTGGFIDDGFLIDFLTPDEYFDFICKIHDICKDECDERLRRFEHMMNGEIVGVNKLIRNLSAGNKQKVAMKNVLDEFSKETGATIIVSSHNLTQTLELSTRITLLENGQIIKDGRKDIPGLAEDIEQYFIHNS